MKSFRTSRILRTAIAVALGVVSSISSSVGLAQPPQKVQVDIPAQDLSAALTQFGRETGTEIVFEPAAVRQKKAAAIQGEFDRQQALALLLKGSGLTYRITAQGAIVVEPVKTSANDAGPSLRLAQDQNQVPQEAGVAEKKNSLPAPSSGEGAASEAGIPEILVEGARTLNVDIKRTEDAVLPYVVFDKKEIQQSQARNLEDFLKTRLPMNTVSAGAGQSTNNVGTGFSVNLRGLGTNQTLILVDGRRLPGVSSTGSAVTQPDLNGIPMGMVERIEVLSSSAGGIYGGSATGGVVNVVLRRDFQGVETRATYENTFDTDAGSLRLDLSGGFNLEGGRTRITMSVARSDANRLLIGDRNFNARALELQQFNNPVAFTSSTAPPGGVTANIRSVSGNLELDEIYGGGVPVPLNSNITHIPLGYAGPGSDNGAALVASAGRYSGGMPNDLSGLQGSLLAVPSMESASFNVRREFTGWMEGFVDVSNIRNRISGLFVILPNTATLPASAPNNPFRQAINVRFPVPGYSFDNTANITTLSATGGMIFRLPGRWVGEADYIWSRARRTLANTVYMVDSAATTSLNTGLPASGRPALNALQEGNTFPLNLAPYMVLPSPNQFGGPYDTVLKNAILRASGPLAQLPAGPLALSAFVERREEDQLDAFSRIANNTTNAPRLYDYTWFPLRSQEVNSAYVEVRAPLFSPRRSLPFARELELQLALRRDEYETRGLPNVAGLAITSPVDPLPAVSYSANRLQSTDYIMGVRYAPMEDMALRLSFGTGFLPPSVTQIGSIVNNASTAAIGIDLKRNRTEAYVGLPYTRITGGNPDLLPEESKSWSAGLILTPRFAPDFRLSIDYTHIEKSDEIQTVAPQFLLDNEGAFPGRIVRADRTQADINAGYEAGRITSIDLTNINIANSIVQSWDFQIDYSLKMGGAGEFRVYTMATWTPAAESQRFVTEALLNRAGYTGGPLKWRGNMGINWERDALTLGWNAQYYDDYLVYAVTAAPATADTQVLNQGSPTIPRQIYHDLFASYSFDGVKGFLGGILAGSEIMMGIQNVFDESPPILATTNVTGNSYSTYGDPRLRRYTLTLRKNF